MRRKGAHPSAKAPRGTASSRSKDTVECRIHVTHAIPTPAQQLAWRRLWDRLLRAEPPVVTPDGIAEDTTAESNNSIGDDQP
jgi:hypothetical protein